MVEHFSAQLTRIRQLSESTKEFRFQRTDDRLVQYDPGQFLRFTFCDNKGSFERSYSLGNFTDASESEVDLVVSAVPGGRASEYLFSCNHGVLAQVTGPYGRLVLPKKLPKRLFLIATSTGVAPFLTMLSILKADDAEVVLLFGVRNRREFLYADELITILKDWANCNLQVCYSRNEAQLNPFENNGYVTKVLGGFKLDPGNDRFLICGNPNMVDDCFDELKLLGFSTREVVREKYLFTSQTRGNGQAELSDDQKRLIAEKLLKHKS